MRTVSHLTLLGFILSLSSACTTNWDEKSSSDRARIKARAMKLDKVTNDNISSPSLDRTDWKYVKLDKKGTLIIDLNWDRVQAGIALTIYDTLGRKMVSAKKSPKGGLHAEVKVEEPGKYYMRVRARGEKDWSHYALRTKFQPEKVDPPPDPPPLKCPTTCEVGKKKCSDDKKSLQLCEKTDSGCTDWLAPIACDKGTKCKEGECVGRKSSGRCKISSRRCSGRNAIKVCQKARNGKPAWKTERCPSGNVCKKGKCQAAAKTASKGPKSVKCKIISLYKMGGRTRLHLECTDITHVKAGLSGTVLDGNSGGALAGGSIRISRVSGRYAIATTSLQKVGNNRWVRIILKK